MPRNEADEKRELIHGAMAGRISRRDFVTRALVLGFSASGIAAVLAACGGGGGAKPAPTAAQVGDVGAPAAGVTPTAPAFVSKGTKGNINVVLWADNNDTYKKIIQKFTEETGIGITYEVAPADYLTWQQLMTTRFASGDTSTDAFHGDDFQAAIYGAADWLEPLGPILDEAKIDLDEWPKTLIEDVSSWKGELYRLPWAGEAELFFYRKDYFKEAGVKPPEDWDDLLDISKKLTQGSKRYAIALNGQKNGVLGNDIQKWTNQAGGAINDLDNDGARKALTFYKDLYATHKVAPASTPQDDYGSNLQGFLANKFAMWWVWDGLYGGIIQDKDFDKTQIDAFVPPKGPENAQTTAACWGWAMNKASTKKDLTRKWIQFIAREDVMKMLITAGRAPARVSLLGDDEVRRLAPQAVYLEPIFKDENLSKARPVTPSIQKVYDAAEQNIHGYLTNQVDLDTAIKRAMDKIQPIVEKEKQ